MAKTSDLADITAQNPALNATLARARELETQLLDERISAQPRIYANKFTWGGYMVPELASQPNTDLPGWATENWDGVDSLVTRGVPSDVPVYLVIYVAEGGSDNFCDVAQIDAIMRNQGKTLRQAVNVQ